ncbi:MAG: phosphatidylserine decarboxylase family protein [Planctomycetes bacterium]|nr:phosphatidylserine decarboxylase family protein [Planctomycetota bacterium]
MRLTGYGRNVIVAVAVICTGLTASIALLGGGWWSLAALPPLLFTMYFFRDPERPVPPGEVVVSAADGRVTAVEAVEEPKYMGSGATRISVFLSVLDVHLNRAPIDGTVEHVEHCDGKFLNAMKEKSAVENERNYVGIRTVIGRVLIVQIAGAIARRIRCSVKAGDSVAKGQRFGMIMFGSRTDVYLPAGKVEIKVKAGDVVRAGKTIIAEICGGQD